jgi:hypothetical protein
MRLQPLIRSRSATTYLRHTTLAMKKLTPLLAFLIAGCVAAPPPASEAPPLVQALVAFVGANVVPMDSERILSNQTVVVRDDRIVALGPAATTEVPAGAMRIDARGKYLLPGLAEMHGHVPAPGAPAEFTESVLFLYLANGITTVRGMLGAPGQLELRGRANRGDLLSPTLYLAGPSFNGQSINSPEEAVQRVRQQKAEGWDLLKVHPGLTLEEYDAMARTAREEGIRFGGHVPADVGLVHAIDMGQETFDHLDGFVEYLEGDQRPVDTRALADIVRRTREAGAWVVPTMALWETLHGTADLATLQAYPELRYMPPQQVRQWSTAFENRLNHPQFNMVVSRQVIDNRIRILDALNRGGVRILMGTDAPQQFSVPGFSLHRELQRMAAAAMTPYEILETGTRNVGEYFKDKDRFGTIAAGQRADLLLVEASPLADIRSLARLEGVMVRGRWLSREEINRRLEQIAAAYQSSS